MGGEGNRDLSNCRQTALFRINRGLGAIPFDAQIGAIIAARLDLAWRFPKGSISNCSKLYIAGVFADKA